MPLDLTNGDCCCVAPSLVIQIKHLASVLSSVCCGYTWDLQIIGHNIQILLSRRLNISYTETKLLSNCVLNEKTQILNCNIQTVNILLSSSPLYTITVINTYSIVWIYISCLCWKDKKPKGFLKLLLHSVGKQFKVESQNKITLSERVLCCGMGTMLWYHSYWAGGLASALHSSNRA